MDEPIAVIGLDARLPCDGTSVEDFFKFLVAGRSARAPVPADRYNADAFWHHDNHRDGIVRILASPLYYPRSQFGADIESDRFPAKKGTS